MKRLFIIFFILVITKWCPAQTIPAPKMECVQINPNGDILLTWKESKKNACGNFQDYTIYYSTKRYRGYKSFPPIKTRTQTTFLHVGANGNTTTWYYYIVAHFACAGYTSISSDTLDNLSIIPPTIHYVSIDDNNHALIRWRPSKGSNVWGYIIYHVVNGKNIPLDTIAGRGKKKYTDTIHDASLSPQSYAIACMDSCGDAGLISGSQTSMKLTIDSVSVCSENLQLLVTPYLGWSDSVAYYSVYVELQAGETKSLNNGNHNSNLSFMDSYQAYANDSVYYYFYAVNKNGQDSARSNRVGINLEDLHLVRAFFLTNQSVANSGAVNGNYFIDATGSPFRIRIERTIRGLQEYVLATNSYLAQGINGLQSFVDSSALTRRYSYTYRLIATDTCDISDTSTLGNTILLTGITMSDGAVLLRWNPFYLDSFAVLNYKIYKWDGAAFQFLSSVSSNTFEYTDIIKNISADSGHFRYVVTSDAQWNSNDFGQQKLTSSSNPVDVSEPPLIVFPNAFRPNGVTPVFKPVIVNPYSISSYRFSLYDRWGELIYETSDYQSGWDGTMNGKTVPTGGYVWLVNTTLSDGNSLTRQGTLVVIY